MRTPKRTGLLNLSFRLSWGSVEIQGRGRGSTECEVGRPLTVSEMNPCAHRPPPPDRSLRVVGVRRQWRRGERLRRKSFKVPGNSSGKTILELTSPGPDPVRVSVRVLWKNYLGCYELCHLHRTHGRYTRVMQRGEETGLFVRGREGG